MNLDAKMLNVQELDSHEMTMHNGGGFLNALLGAAIVGWGALCLVSALKVLGKGIKLLYINV